MPDMKRSSQIALVLMGATSLGATSYALAPRTDCPPPGQQRPPVAAGSPAQPAEQCREVRRSSSGWRSSYYSGSRSSGESIWNRSSRQASAGLAPTSPSTMRAITNPSASGILSSSTSSSVARGGFGSTGHGYSSGS